MSAEFFEISEVIPGTPEQIYAAWLDSETHTAMTQSPTTIEGFVDGSFTAGDGYLTGTTLELEPGRRIVQSWRSREFPFDARDSRLEVRLEPEAGGTRITITHSEIPEGQGDRCREGWREFYFDRMKQYFGAEKTPFDRELTPPAETFISEIVLPAAAPKTKPRKAAAARRAKGRGKAARKAPAARGRRKTAKRATARRASAGKRSKRKASKKGASKRKSTRRSRR